MSDPLDGHELGVRDQGKQRLAQSSLFLHLVRRSDDHTDWRGDGGGLLGDVEPHSLRNPCNLRGFRAAKQILGDLQPLGDCQRPVIDDFEGVPKALGGVDSDAKCNPVDSIGSSTKSRVPIPNAGLLLGFQGTKTVRREGISSPFSDAGGCTSPQNSGSPRPFRGAMP